MPTVRPPPILLLQGLNFLIGLGSFLTAMTATSAWNRAGWSAVAIGAAMTAANLCYALLASTGGRLSDGWGRARTGALGAVVSAVGCALALAITSAETAAAAAMLAFAGAALFYPGNVGLFSDAPAAVGGALPLHVKISRYNLGWACGNFGGFVGYFAFAKLPTAAGFGLSLASYLAVAVILLRYRRLPAHSLPAEGDRSPHPALPRLILMGRLGLTIASILAMAQIALLQVVLRTMQVPVDQAAAWTGLTLTCYAASYIAMFILLGAWDGWVLKPWRLFLLQSGFLLGSLGYAALGWWGEPSAPALIVCGMLVGSAFGAAYTASIFYSLRLPHGAGRAAALHETFIGVGNTAGPVLGGLVLWWWNGQQVANGLVGLGLFMAVMAVIGLGLQVAMIPGAVRLGAR